jgi:RND family efflux transporter MFP subunit
MKATFAAALVLFTVAVVDPHGPPSEQLARAARGAELDQAATPVVDGDVIHGLAEPSRQVELATPFAGVLMKVLVHEGDRVNAGDVVAVMDNRVAEAAVRSAAASAQRTADVEHARYELELAENRLRRIESIAEPSAVAQIERDEARVRRAQAEASLAAAREQHDLAEQHLNLEKTRLETHNIVTPIAGVVTRIDAEPGASLEGARPVLTVADLSRLEAGLYLPLTLYGKLHTGQTYRLIASAPVDRPIDARLVYCEPVVNAAADSFRCVFAIDNRDGRLPAGFAVRFDSATPVPVAARLRTSTNHETGR